ncbi:hypothetical protein C8R46DRAFT_1207223 [Mycena filopes]|nr:hypothetical protein C8R46DRAFT_1207223 [Mycena filopes]
MAPVVIPGIDVPLLTGPLVLGYMWGCVLYGVLVVQLYIYSEAFPRDRPGIKAVVWTMFTLESVFTLFTNIAAWNQYGPGWGDPTSILFIDWAWGPLPALNGILAAICQSFYIWRIWGLTKSFVIPAFIGCIMLTQVTMSFYYGIVVSIQGRGVDKLFALSPEITVWLTASAACDVAITLALVWVFSRQKKRSNFEGTHGIINKLLRFSVETGFVTTLGAIVEVILWLTSRQWNIHFIFFLVLGKLYSNMLMATLNARVPLFRGDPTTSSINGGIPPQPTTFWADAPGKSAPAAGVHHLHPRVHISRTMNVDQDTAPIVMNNFNPARRQEWEPSYKADSLG